MFDINHFKKWRKNTGVDGMTWGKFKKISSFSNIFKTKKSESKSQKIFMAFLGNKYNFCEKKIFFVIREEKKN